MRHVRAGLATAAALLAYSVATNRREVRQGWYVGRNLATAVLLVAGARRRGLTWDALGVGSGHLPDGLRIGARVAAGTTVAVAMATLAATGHPAGRRLLADRRAALGSRELAWQAFVRIPLGTAAFEEVAFRGVLYGIVADRHGPRDGLLVSSVTFGLWHVAPTLAALRINDVTTRRMPTCVAAVALTTVAGVVFGELRMASGHVIAPAIAHWTTNALTLAAAARWQRGAPHA